MEGANANSLGQNVNAEDRENSQEASSSAANVGSEIIDFENASLANENPPIGQTDKNYELVRAIRKENVRRVRKLVGRGADVNHVMEGTNRTPLVLAMCSDTTLSSNCCRIIKILLKAGANANIKNTQGLTLLHIAARSKNFWLTKHALDCGAKVNILSIAGITPLRYGIQSSPNMKSTRFVKLLLDAGAIVNLRNRNGETVIHHIYEAPERESAEILHILIQHGGDVNAQCFIGYTPLHYAVMQKKRHTVHMLLNNVACNPTIKTLPGETAFHLAVRSNDVTLARVLLNAGGDVNDPMGCLEKFTALHVAAARGQLEMFQQLMLFNPDLSILTNRQHTILHSAIVGGSQGIVEIILEADQNINEPDADGNTPIHYAVYQKNVNIVQLLLQYNVDFERKNKNGQTPLHMSARASTILITKLLIAKGADITTRCNNHRSLLQAAFYGDNKAVFRLLLAPHYTPNFEECLVMLGLVDNRERLCIMNALISDQFPSTERSNETKLLMTTVLMRTRSPEMVYSAAADGLEHIINVVTDGGYDVNQLVGGRSFLDAAVKAMSLTIAKLLLNRGIFLNISDNTYFNSLHRAIWHKSYAMTYLLLEHGANVNVISCRSKNTSLHYAVERHCIHKIFMALFAYGADVHSTNVKNFSPLTLSVSHGRMRTGCLIKFEAIVNKRGYVLPMNLKLITDKEFFWKLYKRCLNELDIAETYFIHPRLSVWDLLSKPMNSLIPFMNISNDMEFAEKTELRDIFKLYFELIYFKLKTAMAKKLVHNTLHSHLSDIMGFPSLIVENILMHMTDGDKNLLQHRLTQE